MKMENCKSSSVLGLFLRLWWKMSLIKINNRLQHIQFLLPISFEIIIIKSTIIVPTPCLAKCLVKVSRRSGKRKQKFLRCVWMKNAAP